MVSSQYNKKLSTTISTYHQYKVMLWVREITVLSSCQGRSMHFCQTFATTLPNAKREHFAKLVPKNSTSLYSCQNRVLCCAHAKRKHLNTLMLKESDSLQDHEINWSTSICQFQKRELHRVCSKTEYFAMIMLKQSRMICSFQNRTACCALAKKGLRYTRDKRENFAKLMLKAPCWAHFKREHFATFMPSGAALLAPRKSRLIYYECSF